MGLTHRRMVWALVVLTTLSCLCAPGLPQPLPPATTAGDESTRAAVPGINLVVLLDISGSMEQNGNLSYAAGLARGLLGPVSQAAPTNIVFMAFDDQPRDRAPDKQWITRNPEPEEFAQRMQAAAVAGDGIGTEREWALARGLQLLERFVATYEGDGFGDYYNLVVIITDIDDDPRGYRESPACAADVAFYDAVEEEARLEHVRSDTKRGGDLILEWYRYTLEGGVGVPIPVDGQGEPLQPGGEAADIIDDVVEVLSDVVGLTPQEVQTRNEAREDDLEQGAITISCSGLRVSPEDPYAFSGEFVVSTTYRLHWVQLAIDAVAAAQSDAGPLTPPTLAVNSVDFDLANLLIAPIRLDDAGNELVASVPIRVEGAFVDRPTWKDFTPRRWTATVEATLLSGATLYDSDPSEQTVEWREMNQVGEYTRGLVGTASGSVNIEVSGPRWPLFAAAGVLLAFIAATVLLLLKGQRRIPLGLQVTSTRATYYAQMTKTMSVAIGGEFSALPLGKPFDDVDGGAAVIRVEAGKPTIAPAEGVVLADAAGVPQPALTIAGEGSFILRMAGSDGGTVDLQVSYAPQSFGYSDPLGGDALNTADDYDFSSDAYKDDDLLS